MRVVVTGGSGHIGRAIVEELVTAGHDVINADRVPDQGSQASFKLVELEELGDFTGLVQGCDALVHTAAIPRPGTYPDHVVFRTNMMSLFNALEACRLQGVRRMVWTSSMSVLGYPFNYAPIIPHYLPFDEQHPGDPQDAYALSKSFGEQLCASYARRCGMTIISLRIVWAHTPATFARDLVPFWRNPAAGASNLWSYVDTRDCGMAAHLALTCSAEGHNPCFIAAANSCMPIPTRELIARYYPDVHDVADSLAEYGSLFDTSRSHELLGFRPQHSWESYGLGTAAELNAVHRVP